MDPTLTFIAAVIIALAVLGTALLLAAYLNKGAATREAALLNALESERKARAQIEKEREAERAEAARYREIADKRMAAMETEIAALKSKLAINEARYEIERTTLVNLLRNQGRPSDAGYLPDTPQAEDNAMREWIARAFSMDGDFETLAADAATPVPPPGTASAKAEWIVRWARSNGMSGNLAEAAKKLRPHLKSWREE